MKKAIIWDLDKTCDLVDSKSAGELSIGYLIQNNGVIRENKNYFLELIAQSQTKENFEDEEKQLGELFRSAKINENFCNKMCDYVVSNFKLAGGMIDALYELLNMNYQSLVNSGSFNFVVSAISEQILGIRGKFTAGSILGLDENGYTNGKFIFNIGKQKSNCEAILLSEHGFAPYGLQFTARVSDDVISDAFYAHHAKATIYDPFIWLSNLKETAGDVKVVLKPETRYDMTVIPKILRQYEFGLKILSTRTIQREKELTRVIHKIKKSVHEISTTKDNAIERIRNSIVRNTRNFMRDEVNQELFPVLNTLTTKLEFADDLSSAKTSAQEILEILDGTLEYHVEENWVD